MPVDGNYFRVSVWDGGLREKRQRTAAVQNLAERRSGPVNAKRLGVRQSSGALEQGNRKYHMKPDAGGRELFSGVHFGVDEKTICTCSNPISDDNCIMTTTVEAIYEHGKLLLPEPLSLPEKSHVRVTIESDVEREAWLKLSEENLLKTWNNPDDDVFNELLAK